VIGGRCERCGCEVQIREMEQWFFRITEYADRLLAGLGSVDWPEHVKTMQRNWIGRSEGAEVDFAVENSEATRSGQLPSSCVMPSSNSAA